MMTRKKRSDTSEINAVRETVATGETEYLVKELSVVTDETIQTLLNTICREGWIFDSIHFVVRESSRRPSMAFVYFVRVQKSDRADS